MKIPRSEGKRWIPYDVQETIQEFIEDPESNFGFILINTRMSQEVDFISSENSRHEEQRPKLTITYEAESTPVRVHQNHPKSVHGLNIRTERNLLRIDGSDIFSTTAIKVFRTDGKCILETELQPGGSRELSGISAGAYCISSTREDGRQFTLLSIVP